MDLRQGKRRTTRITGLVVRRTVVRLPMSIRTPISTGLGPHNDVLELGHDRTSDLPAVGSTHCATPSQDRVDPHAVVLRGRQPGGRVYVARTATGNAVQNPGGS